MKEALLTALNALDKNDDAYWTAEGLPRLDILKSMIGQPVTREDIANVAPGFSRTSEGPATAPTEAPVADETATPTEVEGDELQAAISAKRAQLEEVTKDARDANDIVNKVTAELDALINQQSKIQVQSGAADIKAFQASQAKQRAAKNQFVAELTEQVKSQI